jgi:hypothetical protein
MKNWTRPLELLIEVIALAWLLEAIFKPGKSRGLQRGKAA